MMPADPTIKQLLVTLLRQHADLRERIWCCELLVDRFDAGLIEPSQLLHEVTALRVAFDEHNQLEESALRPVLLDADGSGAVRVAHMVEDHVEEHRALRRDLQTPTAVALRAVLASLRQHLASEERHFVVRKVRDDLAG
jgi:Hemerythrin HHE cation binding domain